MENPLVSIVVLTYNSSKYVLETLESAKVQTYQNIELIISDDCSTDNTVFICQKWLEQNNSRFVRTEIIEVEKNTGIPANCNRGVKLSEGEWIKLIAGDDVLDCNIVKNYISIVDESSDINILYSNVKFITNEGLKNHNINMLNLKFNKSETSALEQFQILLRSNPVWAATLMFSKKIANEIQFDEKFRYFEDRPFLKKVTYSGYKIFYFDIVGALYRKHEFSIQTINNEKFLQNKHSIDRLNELNESIQFFDSRIERILLSARVWYTLFFYNHISNHRNTLNKFALYMPLFIVNKLLKCVEKKRK